jgi:predicted nucleotidyltransferase
MGKTASDLKNGGWPKEEMNKYYPWGSLERYSKDGALLARRDRALMISRQIADLLRKKYGATRVVLFGSLAHNAWFTPRSDIDICAEGIPVDRFFQAESEIQDSSEGFKIDLVDPQECSPELLREIEQEGMDL